MSLQTLTDYYSSLLAYQYRGLPNATRQIQLWCALITGEGLPEQMLSAFDLDTAVGAQLDVLGKYIGVSRNIGVAAERAYFGLWASAQPDLVPANYQTTWNPNTNTPALSGTGGEWWVTSVAGASTTPLVESWQPGQVVLCTAPGTFVKYTTNNPNGNGLTTSIDSSVNAYSIFFSTAYLSGQNTDLTDADYRTVLKLKIVLNSSDGTLASIMDYLQEFFPGKIALTDNKNMTLSYLVDPSVSLSPELLAIYLPRPMAVGISVTIGPVGPGGEGSLLTTEGGDVLTTEGGDSITTEDS